MNKKNKAILEEMKNRATPKDEAERMREGSWREEKPKKYVRNIRTGEISAVINDGMHTTMPGIKDTENGDILEEIPLDQPEVRESELNKEW